MPQICILCDFAHTKKLCNNKFNIIIKIIIKIGFQLAIIRLSTAAEAS